MQRLRHAVLRCPYPDLGAGAVVRAVGDDRPAVVHAGTNHIHFVAALWAVFVRPQQAGLRMQRRALHVAIAQRIFFRQPAGFAHERIVFRHAAVVVQADHRTVVIAGILRALHFAAVAEGDKQITFAVEHDARAEVIAGAQLRQHAENDLHVFQLIAAQCAARDFGADALVVPCGIRQVDPIVLSELRMQHHIHQSALAHGCHGGNASHRLWVKLEIATDDAQPSAALGDQHARVGQKGDRPRMRQALGQGGDADAVLLCGVGLCRYRCGAEHDAQQAARNLHARCFHKYLFLNNNFMWR